MDPAAVIPFVLVALAGIALLAWYQWKVEQQRRADLAALAASLGWSFDPAEDPDHDDRFAQFEVFRRGHGRRAYNTLRGHLDVQGRRFGVQAGDFTYKVTSGSGKNRSTTTYRISYLIVGLPWDPPALLIRPENVLDRLAGFLGFEDIDFESEEFSRRFHVTCKDRKFAYDLVHPGMMELLLGAQPPVIDVEAGHACFCDDRGRWDPVRFRARIDFAVAFLARWPRHLLQRLDASHDA